MRTCGAVFAALILCLAARFSFVSIGASAHGADGPGILQSTTVINPNFNDVSALPRAEVTAQEAATYQVTFIGTVGNGGTQRHTIFCGIQINGESTFQTGVVITVAPQSIVALPVVDVKTPMEPDEELQAICTDSLGNNTAVMLAVSLVATPAGGDGSG